MAKKPKPISVNATQTKTYDIDHDASSYAFGSKFKLTSATVSTGIDNATDVLATTMSFGGKINLTGATGTVSGISLDLFDTSTINITGSGSIAASTYGLHVHTLDTEIDITNSGVIASSKGYGIHVLNEGGLAGSLDLTNSKTVSGLIAGIAIFDDGAHITNAKTGKISGASGLWLNDDNVFNDDFGKDGEAVTIITNKGTIAGEAGGWSIHARDVTVALTNSGTLTGNVMLSDGDDKITNLGTINGDIHTGYGQDVVTNASIGTINGNVYLEGGNDRFSGVLASGKSVFGGTGNDEYYFGTSIGQIVEAANEGNDSIYARTNIDLSKIANVDNAYLLGSENLDITGNDLGNDMGGNSGNNTITAIKATNTLYGLDGDDTLKGGSGYDYLYGGNGNDTLNAGTGGSQMRGGVGMDNMTGGTGNDTFEFYQGDSAIAFSALDTIANFKSGEDWLRFFPGLKGNGTANTGNYIEATGAATFTAAQTAANTALGVLAATSSFTTLYALQQVGNDSYLFVDYLGDGTADEAIKLIGVTAATFAASDIF